MSSRAQAKFPTPDGQTVFDLPSGTPRAIAYCASFIPGNSGKARSLGFAVEQCITLGTMAGGGTKPAVCQTFPTCGNAPRGLAVPPDPTRL